MAFEDMLNEREVAAYKLIQNDLRYLYTIVCNIQQLTSNSNYIVSAMPFLGVVIDGVEDWIRAIRNSKKCEIKFPIFDSATQNYYEKMRTSIKLWSTSYDKIKENLQELYLNSERYFSSLCKPIARQLKLYDIFGADFVDGEYCGNTILCNYYIPDFIYGTDGSYIKQFSIIAGEYIRLFHADTAYDVDQSMNFNCRDYGGFIKSPVGNSFSDRFVLFSLLCQINFILFGVAKYIIGGNSTKLRFVYLQYFYSATILPEVNNRLNAEFAIDIRWLSNAFRNAMAHYKLGVALKSSEIDFSDSLYGLTQKYFCCDYEQMLQVLLENLAALAQQLKEYLKLR
nr:hypothetical protein [uncultured Oscillibacter sp.]